MPTSSPELSPIAISQSFTRVAIWPLPKFTGNTNYNATSFARQLTVSRVTLPISLTNYTAKIEGNRARLVWTIASEKDNDRFEIERSTDGRTFTFMTGITGNGTNSNSHTYIVYDNEPSNGTTYYRLKQYDLDGKTTDFGIRSVTFKLNAVVGVRFSVILQPSWSTFPSRITKVKMLLLCLLICWAERFIQRIYP